MEKLTQDLIAKLSQDYGARPWWKNPKTLFLIWFSLHIFYFLCIGYFKADTLVLRSSTIYVLFQLLGSFFSGVLFIFLYRQTELEDFWVKIIGIVILFWIAGSLYIEDFFMRTILHQREFSFTDGDVSCFWHATISTIGPTVLFPVLFRQFFFVRPYIAMMTMSVHLAFLGSFLNELKCPDREMWHLILGHQGPIFGVFTFILLFTFLGQRRSFLKTSGNGKL